jgi:hypothetical protein
MAAAVETERRHQSLPHGPSPLAGIGYERDRGDLDLFRFIESPTDQVIASTVDGRLTDPSSAASVRLTLRQEDLYSLLAYARRRALSALRSNSAAEFVAGLRALALIDLDRVDWRDAAVATGLLAYAGGRTRADVAQTVAEVARLATPAMAEVLMRHAGDPASGLTAGGYREVRTADGIGLVSDHGHPYQPTVDLLARAENVVNFLEADRYRVTAITTGSDLPKVWLPASTPASERARTTLRGCLSVSTRPLCAAEGMPDQMLTVWVGEARAPQDAVAIATAAIPKTGSGIALIGLATGVVCAVLVARSVVQGVPPVEDQESVRRFRAPLMAALAED